MQLGRKKIVEKSILTAVPTPEVKKTPVEIQPVLFDVPAKVTEVEADPFNYKVDDQQFWQTLRRCLGNCSKAARVIKTEYGIEITRQAVHNRAQKNTDLFNECRELLLDTAEEVMMNLMLGSNKAVAADMVKHVTKTLGKTRGFVEKTENTTEVTVKSVSVQYIENHHTFASDETEIDDQ